LLGGVTALAGARKSEARGAAMCGFSAALLADADVFIASASDPLLNVEFHRHFSHSLLFIPIGALIAALLLWPLLHRRLENRRIYWYALLGYATAGLLDACTSYGTHLLWPFSDTRIAWSIIAIVDPLFSSLLLIALVVGFKQRKARAAHVGLSLAGAYLLLGAWQHHNALQAAGELARERGHQVQRILVKPTLANLLLWRSVYQDGTHFHVDAIRVGFTQTRVYPGASVARFERARDLPELDGNSLLARDIERFSRLADGYLVRDPGRATVLTDVRYSMLPTTITPMWGIDLDLDNPARHAAFRVYRDRPDDARERFTAMLLGRDLATP
jgi:inner membrane protein